MFNLISQARDPSEKDKTTCDFVYRKTFERRLLAYIRSTLRPTTTDRFNS